MAVLTRHRAATRVNYDQLRNIGSTANLSVPKSVVNLIFLAMRSVPVISGLPVLDTQVGALTATLATINAHINAL